MTALALVVLVCSLPGHLPKSYSGMSAHRCSSKSYSESGCPKATVTEGESRVAFQNVP